MHALVLVAHLPYASYLCVHQLPFSNFSSFQFQFLFSYFSLFILGFISLGKTYLGWTESQLQNFKCTYRQESYAKHKPEFLQEHHSLTMIDKVYIEKPPQQFWPANTKSKYHQHTIESYITYYFGFFINENLHQTS